MASSNDSRVAGFRSGWRKAAGADMGFGRFARGTRRHFGQQRWRSAKDRHYAFATPTQRVVRALAHFERHSAGSNELIEHYFHSFVQVHADALSNLLGPITLGRIEWLIHS